MDLNLKKILTEFRIDSLLVTNYYNICYITGLSTADPKERGAYVLITKNGAYLMTDGRYYEDFKERYPNTILLSQENGLIKQLQTIIMEEHIHTVGLETEDLSYKEYIVLQSNLKTSLIATDRIFQKLRSVKKDRETIYIKKACEISDACLTMIEKNIKTGLKERQIAWEMEKWVREKGYELCFDPIVAVDANAAIPHYNTKTGEGSVANGSIVLIDFGVKYKDYCSDITRMFFIGDISSEIAKAYSTLKRIQLKTIKMLETGRKYSDIDTYVRKEFEDSRIPLFQHSTGHGVGLEVHEYPKVSINSADDVQKGNVITIEPGIYHPGKWGMRIEDTVLIADNGPTVLTHFRK